VTDATPRPTRVRVTAPQAGGADAGHAPRRDDTDAPAAANDIATTDIEAVYVRSLIRTQFRLAVGSGLAFVTLLVVFGIAVARFAAADGETVDPSTIAGVPLSWLILAFGLYPLMLVVAFLYVRAAARNEAGYRSLVDAS
jgi:hypothetical protein